MAKKFSTALFLGLFLTTFAKEILSYVDGSTMRRENGEPGSKVTGEWSWMDQTGKERTITYVADTNGFRAFGDLVPDDWTSPENNQIPQIGSSVVPAMTKDLNFLDQDITHTTNHNSARPATTNTEGEFSVPDNAIVQITDDASVQTPQLHKLNPKAFTNGTKLEEETMKDSKPKKEEMKLSFIPGTTIVILSQRLPSTFAEETFSTGESQIRPVPVERTGKAPKTITGVLTAPRAKTVLLTSKKAKAFPSSSVRRAPIPSRVDGMLNLDNYFRPAHLPNSNPQVGGGEVADYDYYYYYDDLLYDEANTTQSGSNITSTSPPTSTTTKKTTVASSTSTTTASTTTETSSMLPTTTPASIVVVATTPEYITFKPRHSSFRTHKIKSKKQRSTRSEESLEDSNEEDSEYSEDSDEK